MALTINKKEAAIKASQHMLQGVVSEAAPADDKNIKIQDCENRFGQNENSLIAEILNSSEERPCRVNCRLNCENDKITKQITLYWDGIKKVIQASCSKKLSRDLPFGECHQVEFPNKDIVWHK